MTPGDLARAQRARADPLRCLPTERILAACERVHSAWALDCPVAVEVSRATGFPPASVTGSLAGLFRSLSRERLEGWYARSGLRREMLDGGWGAVRVFGPRLTLIVAGGLIPGAALPSVVQALLLKSPVLVKNSAEPLLLPAYAAALTEADLDVGAAVAIAAWKGGDAAVEAEVLSQVDAVIAYGSDRTLRSLRSRVPASARFLGYGHRISFTAVARERLTPGELPLLAAGLARDACVFDQQGCLSPHAVYVEEGGEISPATLAEAVAAALSDAERDLPRHSLEPAESAALHQYRATAEVRGLEVRKSAAGTGWTVVVDPDPGLRPTPGNRIVVLRPVATLDRLADALDAPSTALISCGLAAPAVRLAPVVESLAAAGVTRFTSPGSSQAPEDALFHDGVGALAALARFVTVEERVASG